MHKHTLEIKFVICSTAPIVTTVVTPITAGVLHFPARCGGCSAHSTHGTGLKGRIVRRVGGVCELRVLGVYGVLVGGAGGCASTSASTVAHVEVLQGRRFLDCFVVYYLVVL